jgi:uncharacterized membrane protein YdjX (TVP38/TMEM64 family)/rhodanese-related sulfurtransferase
VKVGKVVRMLGVLALGSAAAWVFVHREALGAGQLEAWIEAQGPLAPLLFVLAYAVGTVLLVPGSLMTLAGGAIFGPLWGTALNLAGATLGATLAFLVARYLASDAVTRVTGTRVRHLIRGVEAEGWRFVTLVRLVPLFPYNLLNYTLGLTGIRFADYVVATAVGMVPGALAYTYLGYAGRFALEGGEGAVQKLLLAIALLASVVLLPPILRRLRGVDAVTPEQVRRCLARGHEVILLDVRGDEDPPGNEPPGPAGMVRIPLQQLIQRLPELGEARDCPVMVLSRNDRTSARAVEVLLRGGFDARVVAGGIDAWRRSGAGR